MTDTTSSNATAVEVQTVHGRALPVNSPYFLPLDPQELDRSTVQHELFKLTIPGLYMSPELVKAALAPRDGVVPRILDVGTGSGIWAIEMAKEFPHCEVIGLDLVLPASQPSQPSNLVFQVGDANLPLKMDTASIDFVHARFIEGGITNYPQWLSSVSRVLRSNGIYVVITGDPTAVSEDGTDLPTVPVGEPGYTGFQCIGSAVGAAANARRNGIFTPDHWTKWMKEDGHFDRFGRYEDHLQPIGPWKSGMDENARTASELMRKDMLMVIDAWKPLLLEVGHKEELIDRWTKDAKDELAGPRIRVYARWLSAWCVRSNKGWEVPQGSV